MNNKISVIIPVYKVEEFLDDCVQSVIAQTHRNTEIILVDDGSPDNCPAMCDGWAEKDNRIKVIHKPNGGLSDARNAGLDVATGDYISFVDSDDWILPEMYEKMLFVMQKENADICACNIRSCYPDHEEVWGCKEYFTGKSEQILDMLYSDTKYPVSAWNKLYKKECWEKLRFPAGKICEDAFTTYQLVHNAECIVQMPEAFYCYRIRPQSIMTSAFTIKRMDEEEAWRVNYQFVKMYYPMLYKKAFRFYLQKVHVLIRTISREQRKEYSQQFEYLKKIMKTNMIFLVFKSGLNWKYRIKFVLDYIQL